MDGGIIMLFKVFVEEVVTLEHEVMVEANSVSELDKQLDELENEGNHPDDIRYILNSSSTKIVKFLKDDSGTCKFSCPDYDIMD